MCRRRHAYGLFLCIILAAPMAWAQPEALREVVEKHTLAYGGGGVEDQLVAVQFEGTITIGAQRYDFILTKKRPQLLRYELRSPEGDVLLGSGASGEAWIRSYAGGAYKSLPLSPTDKAVIGLHARFDSPLYRGLERQGWELQYLGSSEIDGTNAARVAARSAAGEAADYWIDRSNGEIVQRLVVRSEQSEGLRVRYTDFRPTDGFSFAREIVYSRGDAVIAAVTVDHVRVNPGLAGFFFEPPDRR